MHTYIHSRACAHSWSQTQKNSSTSVSQILRLKVYAIPTSHSPAHFVFEIVSSFCVPGWPWIVTQLLLLIHTEYFYFFIFFITKLKGLLRIKNTVNKPYSSFHSKLTNLVFLYSFFFFLKFFLSFFLGVGWGRGVGRARQPETKQPKGQGYRQEQWQRCSTRDPHWQMRSGDRDLFRNTVMK